MKRKILSILCVFILVSFVFINNNVFASAIADNHEITSFDQDIINYAYLLPEYNETKHLIIKNGNYMTTVRVLIFSKDIDVKFHADYRDYSGNIYVFATPSEFEHIEYVLNIDEDNNISISSGPNIKTEWEIYFDGYDKDGITYTNLYSTVGIYADETHTDFFIRPPVTLAEVLEVTKPTLMFQKLIQNVLVSLVVFLIGFLAFSKAWKWLKTQLSRA